MLSCCRFGIKNVIFGGFIYYTRTSGVWNDSETTYKLAQESIAFTKTFLKPVVNRIEDELPLQVDLFNKVKKCLNNFNFMLDVI